MIVTLALCPITPVQPARVPGLARSGKAKNGGRGDENGHLRLQLKRSAGVPPQRAGAPLTFLIARLVWKPIVSTLKPHWTWISTVLRARLEPTLIRVTESEQGRIS